LIVNIDGHIINLAEILEITAHEGVIGNLFYVQIKYKCGEKTARLFATLKEMQNFYRKIQTRLYEFNHPGKSIFYLNYDKPCIPKGMENVPIMGCWPPSMEFY